MTENFGSPNTNVNFTPQSGVDPAEITVGDTGIYLVQQTSDEYGTWQIHFFPEGNKYAVAGKERQYALYLLSGMHSLVEWWQQSGRDNEVWHFVTNKRQLAFWSTNLPGAVGLTYEDKKHDMYEGVISPQHIYSNRATLANLANAHNLLRG